MKHRLNLKKAALLLLLFVAAYCVGTGIGILFSSNPSKETQETSAQASENWGLSFPKEGERPIGNAEISELSTLNAAYCQDTKEKVIYLTFDCGYENGNSGQILDALKKHKAPATFFIVGTFLRDNPEIVKRMITEGHTVGNHTWHHPDMSSISTEDSFHEELESVETLDQPSKEEAFEKLLGRIHPGAIVLLHNTSSTNAQILDELLTKWEQMGYHIAPLSNLVETQF